MCRPCEKKWEEAEEKQVHIPRKDNKQIDNARYQFLIQEYAQITSYFINVANFRFLVFGFYLASISVIISTERGWFNGIFVILMTIFISIMEMRNRSLARTLKNQGRKIEEIFLENGDNFPSLYHSLDKDVNRMGGKFFGIRFKDRLINYERYHKEDKKIKYSCFPNKNQVANLNDDQDIENKKHPVTNRYWVFSHSFAMDLAYSLAIIGSIVYVICQLCGK